MILDAEERADDWFRDRHFDVCMVGSGPAGITVARALAKRGRSVGLFEGGGRNLTTDSQSLYSGSIVGEDYWPLDTTRLRFFGGTSNHWMGYCRELDAWDFAPHPTNPDSGWPIAKSDLDIYAAETDEILDLEPPRPPVELFPTDGASLEWIAFRFSPPTRFQNKYAKELAQSANIRVHLNANLVGVGLDWARRSITELRFRSFKRDGEFAVKADRYVLCLGGIENARALLNFQGMDGHAIGNTYGLVGRYFTEHPHFTIGQALYKTSLTSPKFLGPKPEFLESAGILNCNIRLIPPSHSEAIGCSTSMTRKLAKIIGTGLRCPQERLSIVLEQALNPESRVRLGDTVDRFGWRRVVLDWRLSEADLRTVRIAAIEAGRVFAKHDFGRVQLADWIFDKAMKPPALDQGLVVGPHHMCTTRMSADPTKGVVDADCRVHGVENLYLGGSSVFATAGHANPTYTIVQLALRLADHLHDRLG